MSAFRAALVALGAAVLTAACAAGQDAQTSTERPAIDGTYGSVGVMQLEGVAVRSPDGPSYGAGADVPLIVYIVNNGHTSDTLTNVASPAFTGGWQIVSTSKLPSSGPVSAVAAAGKSGSPVAIGPGSAIRFSQQNLTPEGGTAKETLVLKGLTGPSAPLFPGTAVKVTFTFANAGQATLTVPVQLANAPNGQTLPDVPSSTA